MSIDLPAVFNCEESYKAEFIKGLQKMLQSSDELGVFILVLANATYDADIFSIFSKELEQKFKRFVSLFETVEDHSSIAAPDDVAVFKQLMVMGFANCGINQQRDLKPWCLKYNPLRSLRPARNSQHKITSIYQPFEENKFHFNKPFLAKEEICQGNIGGRAYRLLYNKFPFADFHALLVLDSKNNKPQHLAQQDLVFLWAICQQLSEQMPNLLTAYNSLGAYASINHQHFQLTLSESAISNGCWTHNGGQKDYPLACLKLTQCDEAWARIDELQKANTAFNFAFTHHALYLTPRLKQGDYTHAKWTNGFGWAEVYGLFAVAQESELQQLTTQNIEIELNKLEIKMTLSELKEKLENHPQALVFEETMSVIESLYSFEETAFKNGLVSNAAGENSGSCKLFSFAQLNDFDQQQTLLCFGQYYRDVLADPEGQSHQNIRQFIKNGWGGIEFSGEVLHAR